MCPGALAGGLVAVCPGALAGGVVAGGCVSWGPGRWLVVVGWCGGGGVVVWWCGGVVVWLAGGCVSWGPGW